MKENRNICPRLTLCFMSIIFFLNLLVPFSHAEEVTPYAFLCPKCGQHLFVTSTSKESEFYLRIPCTHGWGTYYDTIYRIYDVTNYNCGSCSYYTSTRTYVGERMECGHNS